MTTTQTLLPNGTRSGAGDFTVTGTSLIHTATSDSSDSTYVQRTSTGTTASFVVNLGTYTLAADEAVESVRVGVRMTRGGAQSKLYVKQGYVTDAAAGTIRYGAADQYTGALGSITTVYGAARTVAPDGQAWTQARLNDLVVKVTDYAATSGDRSTVYEIIVEVTVNDRPTVTVDGPTGTITATSRPAIEWTYADADGDPQSVYQVRVFTATQYGVSGFDPATSTAAWESDEVTSSDPGVTPSVDLENGVAHRAYVRVGHALGTTVLFSDWAFASFTMNYDSPPAPELSAAFSTTKNVVYVTATGRTNYLSDDDASFESTVGTWTAIAGCSVARTTGYAYLGSASLEITSTSTADMSARSGHYPVATDGQQVSALCRIRPDGSARTVRMLLRWTDGATLLSTTTGSNTVETGAAWTALSITGTPPASATHAQVAVEVLSPASGEIHYVDQVALHPGSTPTWSPGGLYDDQKIVIERSINNGVTWTITNTLAADTPSQQAQGDDYAAERGITNLYRAKVIGYSGQDAVAGPYAESAAAFATNDNKWWIKAPSSPSLNVGAARVLGGSPLSQTREANVGVFRPIGRTSAVVVAGEVYGYDGTYDVLAVGDTEWAALEDLLLDYAGDLIVQSPFGETRKIRVISRSVSVDGTKTLPRRVVTIGYVQV